MITAIRRLGNARGIIIPKPMVKEAGLDEEAEIRLERGAIVLRKPRRNPREGGAEASQRLAEAGDDKLVRTDEPILPPSFSAIQWNPDWGQSSP
jgi:antitoxin MazE